MPKLTAEVDRSVVAADGSSVTAALRIQPGMQEAPVTRQIALCLDTSGSMSGEKIEQVREGVLWVFGYLEDDDHLSIVAFDDEVEVVLPATRWGDVTLDEAEAVVDDITPGGGTDVLAGLETAAESLSELPTGEDVGRRIILLSDGRDETPQSAYADFARRVRRDEGVSIPAAGIGEFYDEDTIRAVGTASEGEWVHLSRAEDIENFFGRKVETLRTVVAPSPNLEFDLAEGATVGEVYLRQPQVRDASHERVGDSVRVYLPDLLEFETQEVVLTIETPPCAAGEAFTLADVTLHTREDSTATSIEVTCADDAAGRETRIENESVTVKHLETMVRKAASEGDVERAQTILDQAASGGTAADLAAQDTVVQSDSADDGVDDSETVVRGDSVDDSETVVRDDTGDDEPTDMETVIQGDDEPPATDRPDDVGEKETVISPGPGSDAPDTDDQTDATSDDDEAPSVPDLETVIDERTLSDLETVIDDETVDELQTVIEEADEDDLEAQYETTVIRDEERR